jgi:hypothetical protein
LQTIKCTHVDIEENSVVVCITIRRVNAFKPLRELHIAEAVSTTVHHKAHPLP